MEESREQHASSRIARGLAQRRSRRSRNFSRSRARIMARIFNARTVENVAPYVQQSASSWLALFFHRSQHQYYYWRRGTRGSAGFREHCRNWVEIFASINESFSLADTSLQCFFRFEELYTRGHSGRIDFLDFPVFLAAPSLRNLLRKLYVQIRVMRFWGNSF